MLSHPILLIILLLLTVLPFRISCLLTTSSSGTTVSRATTTFGTTSTSTTTSSCLSYSYVLGQELTGVCVCNTTHCHEIPTVPSSYDSAVEALMYVTSKAGKRLDPITLPLLTNGTGFLRGAASQIRYDVDMVFDLSTDANRAQTIMGFGGSWTDSVASNIYSMEPDVQQAILEAYYGETGLQYTLARVTMASTDFSPGVFSYNDHLNDFDMTRFSIDVDLPPKSNKIPMIQRILALSQRNITIYASPWAPPQWMTLKNNTINSAIPGYPTGDDSVEGRYWKSWALYFSKFLTAYAEQGVPVSAITVQNEPANWTFYQFAKFQSLRMDSLTQRDFVKKELGPLLRQDHPNVQIIIADDQKIALPSWTAPILDDPEAAQYVSGVGFHWYSNMDFAIPGMKGFFGMIANHHKRYPNFYLLPSEACEGARVLPPWLGTGNGVKINETDMVWRRGENYARDIIGDLQSYSVGWTDWNIVLDLAGGPSWANKGLDAPILVDRYGGQEWYKQPMYYIMGHFSKFIVPGSVRLPPARVRSSDPYVEAVAFLTPDEKSVVVALQNRRSILARRFRIQLSPTLVVEGTLDPDSVSTLIIPVG